MAAGEATLVFEAGNFESCTTIIRQFFREHRSANIVRVALSTRDLKPLGARVWRVVDENVDAVSYNRWLHHDPTAWVREHFRRS